MNGLNEAELNLAINNKDRGEQDIKLSQTNDCIGDQAWKCTMFETDI